MTPVTHCPSRFRSMGVALRRIVMTRNDARTLLVYYRPRAPAHGRAALSGEPPMTRSRPADVLLSLLASGHAADCRAPSRLGRRCRPARGRDVSRPSAARRPRRPAPAADVDRHRRRTALPGQRRRETAQVFGVDVDGLAAGRAARRGRECVRLPAPVAGGVFPRARYRVQALLNRYETFNAERRPHREAAARQGRGPAVGAQAGQPLHAPRE